MRLSWLRRGTSGLQISLLTTALAVVAAPVLTVPLGLSEAPELLWLARFVNAAGLSAGAFDRAFVAAYRVGQPALTLALATAVSKSAPGLDALIALRLPDALAALGLTWTVYRLAGSGEAGLGAGIWALIFAVACVAWAGPPGLVLDQGAAVGLLYAYDAHARARGPAWPGLALGVLALAANGAGVYVIAVLAGAWLHAGLARRDWRLLGSHRLTALAGLIVADLTLTPALNVPRLAPFAAFYQALAGPIRYDGVPGWILGCLAAWGVLALVAIAVALVDIRAAIGRYALIVAIGCLIVAASAAAPPVTLACLAPLLALWLLAPAVADDAGAGPRRWRPTLYALIFMGQALVLMIGLMIGSTRADDDVAGISLIGVIALAVVLLAGTAVIATRRASTAADRRALPMALCVLALAVAVIGVLAQPKRIAPQRMFDQSLAAAMASLSASPIAILAPADPDLWRAELARPVFPAADPAALCRWASQTPNGRPPIAMVPASATNVIIGRFPAARRILQSPGTPSSSTMVIGLDSASTAACQGGSRAARGLAKSHKPGRL